MMFATVTPLARAGRFELIRKGFTRGNQYEIEARFGQRKFFFKLSRWQFTLEFRPA